MTAANVKARRHHFIATTGICRMNRDNYGASWQIRNDASYA